MSDEFVRCEDVMDETVDVSESTEQHEDDTARRSMHRDASLEDKEGSVGKTVERKDLEEDVFLGDSEKSEAVFVAYDPRNIIRSEVSNDDTSIGDSNILDISEGDKTIDHSEYVQQQKSSESIVDESKDQKITDHGSEIEVSNLDDSVDETDDEDELYCDYWIEDLTMAHLKKYEELKALSWDILENARTCMVISGRNAAETSKIEIVDRTLQRLNEISEELSEECEEEHHAPSSLSETKNLFTLIKHLSKLNEQEAEEVLGNVQGNLLERYYNGFKSFRNEHMEKIATRLAALETELNKMETFVQTDLRTFCVAIEPLELTFEKWASLNVLNTDVVEWNRGLKEIARTAQQLRKTFKCLQKNVNKAFSAYFKYVKIATKELSLFLCTEIPNLFKELPKSIKVI